MSGTFENFGGTWICNINWTFQKDQGYRGVPLPMQMLTLPLHSHPLLSHPLPPPRVQLPVSNGVAIGVARPGKHLVTNFWRQVPPQMSKLPLQVAKLPQDPTYRSQNDPKIPQLRPLVLSQDAPKIPSFKDVGANLDLQTLQKTMKNL